MSNKSKKGGPASVRPLAVKPTVKMVESISRQAESEANGGRKRFFPLPFLAVLLSFFVESIFPNHWEFAWSVDNGPRWVQPGTLLLAIVSLWSLVEALMATQIRTMAIGDSAEESQYTTRRLFEAVGRRSGFMTLWLTVLGAIACGESGDINLKPTSVLSDMATVGVVLGLALCVPLGLSTVRHCFIEMRQAGKIQKLREGYIAVTIAGSAMGLAFWGALGQLIHALRT